MFAPLVSKKTKPGTEAKSRAEPSNSAKQSPEPNRVWQSLALHAIPIQPKLSISHPGDRFEREADRIADHVMRPTALPAKGEGMSVLRASEVQPQRKADCCGDGDAETNQRDIEARPAETSPSTAAIVRAAVNSGGQPLDPGTRSFMETRFGYDFGQVRIHANEQATQSARALAASAYTVGSNLVFNAGRYSPESGDGRRLIAHELTHVVQQRHSSGPALTVQRQCEGEIATPPQYTHCDAATTGARDPTADITEARRRASVSVNDALTLLARLALNSSAPGADYFQDSFGVAPTRRNVRAVTDVYNRICAWLFSTAGQTGNNIRCQPVGSRRCPRPSARGVVAGSMVATRQGDRVTTSSTITLCPSTLVDLEEGAGTIIHEAAHVARVLPRARQRERYEQDRGFPAGDAIHTSADSYRVFARQAHVSMGIERLQAADGGLIERPITTQPAGPGPGE